MPTLTPLEKSFQFQGWTIRYSGDRKANNDTRKPVVFVHGTPWSSDVFNPVAQALTATGRFRPILYDLPGYGVSQELDTTIIADSDDGKFAGDTSVKFQAMALAALLQHLELDKGEKPAVRAVIRSACFNPQVLASGWEDLLAKPWVGSESDEREAHAAEQKQSSFVRQIAQANNKDVAEMLDQNLYSKIRCPVKIIWGQDDQWIPEEKMRRLTDSLNHCLEEFVVVENAGHLVMLDQPGRISCEVFSWIDKH